MRCCVMKFGSFCFIFLLVSASCYASSDDPSRNVGSLESIDTKTFNEIIQKAHHEGLGWSVRPELYIFYLFDLSEIKSVSYEYSFDSVESPNYVNINLVRDGFLDDSVRGDIQYLKLRKNKNGTWNIISIKKARSCWRKKNLTYSSEACL